MDCKPIPIWIDVCGTGSLFDLFTTAPWLEGATTQQAAEIKAALDMELYYNYLGQKHISPLVLHLLGDDETLSNTSFAKIATVIKTMYGEKWDKEWETLTYDYDPISNYDMTEIMSNDRTVRQKGSTTTRTNNLTDTERPNTVETNTPQSLTTTTSNTLYGFNSSAPVPSSGQTQVASGSASRTRTGTDTTTHTGTVTEAGSGADTDTRNYTLTRTGNIGVTTSQQMIESQRVLWFWDYFYTVVFPDIARIITIPIY